MSEEIKRERPSAPLLRHSHRERITPTVNTSMKLMLLGIALMLFHLVGGVVEAFIFAPILNVYPELAGVILPVTGLVLVFVGFFKRDAATSKG